MSVPVDVVPPAVADVQARVASLQQRIAALASGSPVAVGASSTTSRTFASTLATVQAQLDASGSASTAGAGGAIVADAMTYLGTPYRWGGTDPSTGLDCSGLVQRVLADQGISAPRTAAQQAAMGTAVPSLAQARPGDLLVFEGGHHIGIYVGDGKMVHAPKTGDVVKISDVPGAPDVIRRVTGTSASSTATALAALRSAVLGTAGVAGATSAAGTSSTADGRGYGPLFTSAEARYGLPTGLLSAVAGVESGYRASAVSAAGAQGLMQLMPGTARELGVDATDPAQAVDGAARLLKQGLDRFGSVPLAVAAYNAGAGAVAQYGGVPPYAETQAYVRKVTAALSRTATGA